MVSIKKRNIKLGEVGQNQITDSLKHTQNSEVEVWHRWCAGHTAVFLGSCGPCLYMIPLLEYEQNLWLASNQWQR